MKNVKSVIREIIDYPLSGHTITIVEHSDRSFVKLQGKILEETKQMILINCTSGDKWVSKLQGIFLFQEYGIKIDGKLLVGTSKNRSKRKLRSW